MEQLPKIVQRGLPATQKAGNHPDPDLLTAFAEKSLTDRERVPVLQHLAECADCREVVSLAMPLLEPAPGLSAERASRLNWPLLRWGALAACVVVVSAAVTLRYEHRQTYEAVVAEQVPSAPAGLTAQSEASRPPAEQMAANHQPSAPSRTERDMAAAGKLDAQRAMTDGKMVAPEAKEFAGYQSKKVQDPGSDRMANAGAMKSAGERPKPAAPLVSAVDSSSPAAKASRTDAQTEPQAGTQNEMKTEARNGRPASLARTTTETATAAPAGPPSELKAKDELTRAETQKAVPSAGATSSVATVQDDRNADTASLQTAKIAPGEFSRAAIAGNRANLRWTLSAGGELQRSLDSGSTWRVVPVASHTVFRALAANGPDLWIGGAAGALYHSSDAGQHWIQVKPVAEGNPLADNILTLEFSDPMRGKLTTAAGETWSTSDAGLTWQIR